MRRGRSVLFLATAGIGLLVPLAAAQGRYQVMDWAWTQFRREVLVETAGLFWLGAEAAILLGMTLAVRILGERPLPATIQLTALEWRYVRLTAAGLLVIAAFVYSRHLVLPPLPWAFTSIGRAGGDLFGGAEAAYYVRAHLHIALWCGFVVAWMALEAAIVAQGLRAFYRLRGLVSETGRAA